jgi:hypothetical protein
MAWVQIQKSTEAKWSDYENVRRAIGDDPPEGLVYHAAGEVEGGRWQSVSIWESEEHFDRFREQRLEPAVSQALGDEVLSAGPPPSESFETKDVWKPLM